MVASIVWSLVTVGCVVVEGTVTGAISVVVVGTGTGTVVMVIPKGWSGRSAHVTLSTNCIIEFPEHVDPM